MMKNKIPLPPASLLLTELHLSPYQVTDFIELDLLAYNFRQVIRDSGS